MSGAKRKRWLQSAYAVSVTQVSCLPPFTRRCSGVERFEEHRVQMAIFPRFDGPADLISNLPIRPMNGNRPERGAGGVWRVSANQSNQVIDGRFRPGRGKRKQNRPAAFGIGRAAEQV